MKSSIYISSEKVYAIDHARGKINDFVMEQLPEGIIINGMITDPAQLAECLSSMKKSNPSLFANAALVVDGSSVLVRRLEAPKLNNRQLDQLIRDDFAHSSENADELVCGYEILGKTAKGGTEILACAADSALVDSYIDTFKSAGIQLEAIHIGIQAITSFVASKKELAAKTVVLNLVDGFMMLSIIFDKGKNVLIRRSRLHGEDELQLASNMLDSLSGIIQFARSEQFNDITDSYYIGISKDELRLLEMYSTFADVKLHTLDVGTETRDGRVLPSGAHFACLNMLLEDKSVNLVTERRNLEKRKKRLRPKKHWLTALIVYTLLLMVPVGVFYVLGRQLDGEIKVIEDYLNAPATIEKINYIDALDADTSRVSAMVKEHEDLLKKQDSMIPITDKLLDLAFNTYSGHVDVSSFDFNEETGILYLSATCDGESQAAQYVKELRRDPMVIEIDYTGYSYRSTGEYDFSIQVLLYMEKEGR